MKKFLYICYLVVFSTILTAQTVTLPPYQGALYTGPYDCGTATITDNQGNVYHTVKIGNQCWMKENLKYLPSINPPSSYSYDFPRYYVYGYNGSSVSDARATENYAVYGVLYNRRAAAVSCPAGWHLPSASDWDELINFCGGTTIAGNKLKENGGTHWNPFCSANNETGFTALPGGYFYRRYDGVCLFDQLGVFGMWYTSNPILPSTDSWYISMDCGEFIYQGTIANSTATSVRCLKD